MRPSSHDDRTPIIVAEVGSNHDGSLEKLLNLVEMAGLCGADAVKIQLFRARDLVPEHSDNFDALSRLEFQPEWMEPFMDTCAAHSLEVAVSSFSLDSLSTAEQYPIWAHKIASSENSNLPFIAAASKSNKYLILSTGMSDWHGIEWALDALGGRRRDVTLLHCVASYPTETEELHLAQMVELGRRFGLPFGLSDHTMSTESGAWAVAMGATMLEKHVTLDPQCPGPDHHYALAPKAFRAYCESAKSASRAVGSRQRTFTPQERLGRRRQHLRLRRSIRPGEQLEFEHFELVPGANDLDPSIITRLIELTVTKPYSRNHEIDWDFIANLA